MVFFFGVFKLIVVVLLLSDMESKREHSGQRHSRPPTPILPPLSSSSYEANLYHPRDQKDETKLDPQWTNQPGSMESKSETKQQSWHCSLPSSLGIRCDSAISLIDPGGTHMAPGFTDGNCWGPHCSGHYRHSVLVVLPDGLTMCHFFCQFGFLIIMSLDLGLNLEGGRPRRS